MSYWIQKLAFHWCWFWRASTLYILHFSCKLQFSPSYLISWMALFHDYDRFLLFDLYFEGFVGIFINTRVKQWTLAKPYFKQSPRLTSWLTFFSGLGLFSNSCGPMMGMGQLWSIELEGFSPISLNFLLNIYWCLS